MIYLKLKLSVSVNVVSAPNSPRSGCVYAWYMSVASCDLPIFQDESGFLNGLRLSIYLRWVSSGRLPCIFDQRREIVAWKIQTSLRKLKGLTCLQHRCSKDLEIIIILSDDDEWDLSWIASEMESHSTQ